MPCRGLFHQLPGRNSRLGEPKHTEMSELVADLLEGILPLISEGAPYAIFGHSMVSFLGYKVQPLARMLYQDRSPI